jgi:two-component system response regulator
VPQPQPTILLVEDNPRDAELTMMALERHRIANIVVLARDGVEALDYLFNDEQPNPLPQLVLLDLKLPKIDGLEVLERIRADERTAHLPVVVLTSSAEERDLVASYRRHANSYVQKPVDFQQFSGVVEQLGLYWLVVNKTPDLE